jgi:ubiquinone/menaquinone biosynthesis C-methylase UbiE
MARETVRRPVFARIYSKFAAPALARAGITEYRRRLVGELAGEVLEVGAGNGMNLPYYPPAVTRLVAVEPEPRLRALAEQAARTAPVPVEVSAARGERLPFPDASFDAAVVCLTLCSVADQPAAVTELHRVLRPGGRLRFFEHVQADSPGMRRVQKAVDATLWPLVCGGCHTGRDTAGALAAAGFTVTEIDRFAFPATRIPMPAGTHILGTAERPAQGAEPPRP